MAYAIRQASRHHTGPDPAIGRDPGQANTDAALDDLLDRVVAGLDLGQGPGEGRLMYLYGLTGPLSAPVYGCGLENAPVEATQVGPLTAFYTRHDQLHLRLEPETCLAHEAVLQTVMDSQAALPVAFGTTFTGREELQATILRHTSALRERLSPIIGTVEMAVRINPLSFPDGQNGNGRSNGPELLSAQRRQALAESTLACLRELSVASRLAARQPSHGTVSLSYLVESDGVGRFVRAVGRLQNRWPEFRLRWSGPWSPYTFVADPLPVGDPPQPVTA